MYTILAIAWIICGISNYGFMVAFFQKTFPTCAYEDRVKDRVVAAIGSLAGPIALLSTFITLGQFRKGWMI
jgi:hypothetical protein